MADVVFLKGLTACAVGPSPDGWEWLPYVGVDASHPFYGRRFVVLGCGHDLTHVPYRTGDPAHDARWWFVIDARGCRTEDEALQKVRAASDELTYGP